jgi:hypothetical protein
MRLQRISKCSIRKDKERTKGENRQEANHVQIFPRPRLLTSQRWASSRDRLLSDLGALAAWCGPRRCVQPADLIASQPCRMRPLWSIGACSASLAVLKKVSMTGDQESLRRCRFGGSEGQALPLGREQ